MRLTLWAIVAVLIVLAFASDNVRRYFEPDVTDVAPQSSPDGTPRDNFSTRGNVNPSTDKPETEKPSPARSYVPSPADAPELYDSPAKRFGF